MKRFFLWSMHASGVLAALISAAFIALALVPSARSQVNHYNILDTFTIPSGATCGGCAANSVVITNGASALTTDTGLTFDAATDVLTIGGLSINPGNGSNTFSQIFSLRFLTSNELTLISGAGDGISFQRNGSNAPYVTFKNAIGLSDVWLQRYEPGGLFLTSNGTLGGTMKAGIFRGTVAGATAANVVYGFTGDNGLGMFSRGANRLSFAAGGIEYMQLVNSLLNMASTAQIGWSGSADPGASNSIVLHRYADKQLMISGDGTGATTNAGLILGYLGTSGYGAIWPSTVSPTTANFGLRVSSTDTILSGGNISSGGFIQLTATAGQGPSIVGGTATTDVNALNVTQTWNNAGVTFTGIKGVFQGTGGGSSNLVDLQYCAGAACTPDSIFRVQGNGGVFVGTSASTNVEFSGSDLYGRYLTTRRGRLALAAGSGDSIYLVPNGGSLGGTVEIQGGVVTTSAPVAQTQTWNGTISTIFTASTMGITKTSSSASSNFAVWSVDGVPKHTAGIDGSWTSANGFGTGTTFGGSAYMTSNTVVTSASGLLGFLGRGVFKSSGTGDIAAYTSDETTPATFTAGAIRLTSTKGISAIGSFGNIGISGGADDTSFNVYIRDSGGIVNRAASYYAWATSAGAEGAIGLYMTSSRNGAGFAGVKISLDGVGAGTSTGLWLGYGATSGEGILLNSGLTPSLANAALRTNSTYTVLNAPDTGTVYIRVSDSESQQVVFAAGSMTINGFVTPASSGTRFLCIGTTGVVTSSASVCSGT